MKRTPLFIRLRPTISPCLGSFIIISHFLAVMALFLSAVHETLRILLLVPVMLNCYLLWSRFMTRDSISAIVGADWLSDDSWHVFDGKGQMQQAASCTVLLNIPALIMLEFKVKHNRALTLIICPGSIDREVRRQLRVRLNTS